MVSFGKHSVQEAFITNHSISKWDILETNTSPAILLKKQYTELEFYFAGHLGLNNIPLYVFLICFYTWTFQKTFILITFSVRHFFCGWGRGLGGVKNERLLWDPLRLERNIADNKKLNFHIKRLMVNIVNTYTKMASCSCFNYLLFHNESHLRISLYYRIHCLYKNYITSIVCRCYTHF